jgi:hypothetical protein
MGLLVDYSASPSPLMSPSSSGVSGSGGPGFSSSEEQPNQGPTLKAMIDKKANFLIFYVFLVFIVFIVFRVNGSLWPQQGPNKPSKSSEIKDFHPVSSAFTHKHRVGFTPNARFFYVICQDKRNKT